MKGILYLFSLWLLLLTGIPCPDAECHVHTDKTAHPSNLPADDEHEHKAPCSPFCHCATCAGFSVPRPFSYWLTANLFAAIPSRQQFNYQSPSQADVVQTVWQPPKL